MFDIKWTKNKVSKAAQLVTESRQRRQPVVGKIRYWDIETTHGDVTIIMSLHSELLDRTRLPVFGSVRTAWSDQGTIMCWLFPRVYRVWENVRQFIPCLPFIIIFLNGDWLAHTKFYSLGQNQSTVAQRAETSVTECSLTSYVWARFLIGSHTMPGQRHSQSTPTSLGQRCHRV